MSERQGGRTGGWAAARACAQQQQQGEAGWAAPRRPTPPRAPAGAPARGCVGPRWRAAPPPAPLYQSPPSEACRDRSLTGSAPAASCRVGGGGWGWEGWAPEQGGRGRWVQPHPELQAVPAFPGPCPPAPPLRVHPPACHRQSPPAPAPAPPRRQTTQSRRRRAGAAPGSAGSGGRARREGRWRGDVRRQAAARWTSPSKQQQAQRHSPGGVSHAPLCHASQAQHPQNKPIDRSFNRFNYTHIASPDPPCIASPCQSRRPRRARRPAPRRR